MYRLNTMDHIRSGAVIFFTSEEVGALCKKYGRTGFHLPGYGYGRNRAVKEVPSFDIWADYLLSEKHCLPLD